LTSGFGFQDKRPVELAVELFEELAVVGRENIGFWEERILIGELLVHAHQELAKVAFTMHGEHSRPVVDFLVRTEFGQLFRLHGHVGPEEIEIFGLRVSGDLELHGLGDVAEDLVLGL